MPDTPSGIALLMLVMLLSFVYAAPGMGPIGPMNPTRPIGPIELMGVHNSANSANYPVAPDDSLTAKKDSFPSYKIYLLSGGLAAANVGIMAYYFSTYYADNESTRSRWHTFNDWYNSDLNIDKLGHIWATQAYARTMYRLFRWSDLDHSSSVYWSSAVGFAFQLEMELTDGMYKKWGFSWGDMAGNTVGALYPILQDKYPFLQGINLKMSYHPSHAAKQGWLENTFLQDYDGFTYWLALTVHDFLPASMKPYWPSWLGLAVGYGGSNVMIGKHIYNSDSNNKGLGQQEWYLALDVDLRKLPGETPFLRLLKNELNMIHLPMPTIRFTPTTIMYGLYF